MFICLSLTAIKDLPPFLPDLTESAQALSDRAVCNLRQGPISFKSSWTAVWRGHTSCGI